MEFLSFNFVSFILFFAFILAFLKDWKRKSKLLPPSPLKLPLIGNLHQLAGGGGLPPHHILRNLAQKYGPLMHLQVGEIPTLVVSSAEVAEKVMKTHDLAFANRAQFITTKIIMYNCADIALSPYGEYWRQMRKVCILELLSTKNVRSFDSIRNEEALRLIESIKATAVPIDVRQQLGEFTSSMVCKAALGRVSKEDRNTFLKVMEHLLSLSITMDVVDLFPSLKILHPFLSHKSELLKGRKQLDGIMDRIIDQHSENFARTKQGMGESGQEDVVDVLLRLKQSGELQIPITNDNIKAIIMDVFLGATENPSVIVEWAMAEMIKTPNVMAKAQSEIRHAFSGKETIQESDVQELKYLKLVIKETLRLHPMLPFLVPRKCRDECEIDGYSIPINTTVMVNVWAIGRDPKYWEDPESFKPERFETLAADYYTGTNFHYLPFGAGRRACPGISFGLANVELPLALLLYHFDWKLPGGLNPNDLDMSETVGKSVMKKDNLKLLATLYDPSLQN